MKAPENCARVSLIQMDPQLVLFVIRFLIFLLFVKRYMLSGFSLWQMKKGVHGNVSNKKEKGD